jgi:hypothetical protein
LTEEARAVPAKEPLLAHVPVAGPFGNPAVAVDDLDPVRGRPAGAIGHAVAEALPQPIVEDEETGVVLTQVTRLTAGHLLGAGIPRRGKPHLRLRHGAHRELVAEDADPCGGVRELAGGGIPDVRVALQGSEPT